MQTEDKNSFSLKEKVSMLPGAAGVYQFLDSTGTVIYVGKAKNLKKRVSSYFVSSANHAAKVRVMVRKVSDMRHTVVGSESEALLLENSMIKSIQPRYNILLKDDKTFPWIVIRNEPFPRVQSTRTLVKDGSQYFGPYSSVYTQKKIIELLNHLYSLRTCSLNLSAEAIERGNYRVCLKYHLGNCKGPCEDHQHEQDYNQGIALAVSLLKGDVRATRSHFQRLMEQAANELRFEQAGSYKQKIEALDNYQSKSVVVSNTITDLDVFSLIIDEGVAFCNFMRIVSGAVVNTFSVELRRGVEDSPAEVLAFAISHIGETVGSLSKEVIVPFMPQREMFPGIDFATPRRGDKARLMELSEQNCRLFRLEKLKQIEIKDPQRHTNRVLDSLEKELQLTSRPHHIECFDNSNLQGTNPVAACVVFRDGKPSTKEYRHFNIKTVVGANDFASMEEVVTRRYSALVEQGKELPQLIVIDGGKGQLSFACAALKRLGIYDKVAIIALAERFDEVFFPDDSTPYNLDRNSSALRVIKHIRDEAHRFGISFHRKKRSLNFIQSELESIPTLGERSVEKLLRKFKSVSKIKKASQAELAEVVGAKRAVEIINYFASAK